MSKFVDLIAKVRSGAQPTDEEVDAACVRPEQYDFYLSESSRPAFIDSVSSGENEQEQREADDEKDARNAENGYDNQGNVTEPIPEGLK